MCHRKINVIFIDYAKHNGLIQLDNTLRHELIHYRFPGMSHGKKFVTTMKELKSGKTWEYFDRTAFVESSILESVMYKFRVWISGQKLA